MNIKYNHTLHTHNPKSAIEVFNFLFTIFKPKSILDVGCGNGSWLKASKDLGVKSVFGVDGITTTNNDIFISPEEFKEHNLTLPLDLQRQFDLVISLEVAEHLPESVADEFIKTLIKHGDVILFSAAIPGQGGQYHINEQWPEYWNKKFKKKGYVAYDILREKLWNNEDVLWWYKQNIILYVKNGLEEFKEYQFNDEVISLVHPSLYLKKEFKPTHLNSKKEIIKSIKNHLKCLFRK
jgi:SAM-dependent methyltransferase